jgi:hypothetical protein
MTSRHKESDEDIERDFNVLVNMSGHELADWLETEESRSVGWHHEGEDESVGHQSGRRILKIQRGRDKLTEDDRAHMHKVVACIKRHLAQRPHHDVEHTRRRYSLMNWGHDPLKD